ncbi:hypothetical protein E1B28_012742 [Marasmius oreades]|uniref:Beta-glucosidase n=1 Tax=Marasmius oreades TaxID=181124 RepID=A0A9P7RT74_9AGAR|nr:uncharacterized protein E1B28_012742 [Marasmius oreades]KAG7088776.1 hypothetical protein E1B28_012742 [Marasmius oreades]
MRTRSRIICSFAVLLFCTLNGYAQESTAVVSPISSSSVSQSTSLVSSRPTSTGTLTSSASATTSQATTTVINPTSTGTLTSSASATTSQATTTVINQSQGASFPPVGSIPREYSPENLDRFWAIVGEVEAPPFTTTPVPKTPIALPTPPPQLYPSFFSPAPKDILPDLKFPKGFLFGLDTAAFQVEGAVKDEGKGPTMWDWATRQPNAVIDNTTGDITDLQYFLYKEDTARVTPLGVNAHSFSISWSRIFPFGTADSPVNQAGLDHYSDLIDYSIEQGVEPVVTLFHWDTPLPLQSFYGGFTSGEIVNDFVHYAKTVFKAYNGRVKTWYTFNEPRVYCGQIASYPFDVTLAPGVNVSTAPYQCSYNLIRAHARAVKAFREMGIQGEIAFKNDDFIGPPWRINSTEDAEASERHTAFQIGVFSDPIYKTGDWPKILTDTLPPSYLPRLNESEKRDILGSADFFAIDSYRVQLISAPRDAGGIRGCVADESHPLWPTCNEIMSFDTGGWSVGVSADPAAPWLQATPGLLRGALREMQKRWPTKKMYISEFGFVEPFEGTRQPQELFQIKEDVARTNYFMTYLGEILLAIHEDKLPIAGAFAWSMVDNIEWGSGLSTRFGIQYVDDTTLERSYKRSAFALAEFFKAHLQ